MKIIRENSFEQKNKKPIINLDPELEQEPITLVRINRLSNKWALDSTVSCDVIDKDSPALSQTSRGVTTGKIERLGTRLGSQGFSLGLWKDSIPDLHEKALKIAHTTPGT